MNNGAHKKKNRGNMQNKIEWFFDNLDFGYEIKRQKGIFSHTGIIVGYNSKGQLLVFHNHPDSGPKIVTLLEFCDGMKAYYTGSSNSNRNEVWNRVVELLNSGRVYDGLAFNCHQASSYVISGVEKSAPVQALKWGVGLTVLGLAIKAISESNQPKRRKLR